MTNPKNKTHRKLQWWEKTVEYAFTHKIIKESQLATSPLAGNIEADLGDCFTANKHGEMILIEFKDRKESIKSEKKKYFSTDTLDYIDGIFKEIDTISKKENYCSSLDFPKDIGSDLEKKIVAEIKNYKTKPATIEQIKRVNDYIRSGSAKENLYLNEWFHLTKTQDNQKDPAGEKSHIIIFGEVIKPGEVQKLILKYTLYSKTEETKEVNVANLPFCSPKEMLEYLTKLSKRKKSSTDAEDNSKNNNEGGNEGEVDGEDEDEDDDEASGGESWDSNTTLFFFSKNGVTPISIKHFIKKYAYRINNNNNFSTSMEM